MIKYCSQCERDIDVTNFFRHPTKKDGLQPICKDCQRRNNRWYKGQQRKKNPLKRYGLRGKELNEAVNLQIKHLQELRK